MTGVGGIVVLLPLLRSLRLRERLRTCFGHDDASYPRPALVVLLALMLMLGFRRLSSVALLEGDPLVLRVLGLSELPSVSTLSRMLSEVSPSVVEAASHLGRDVVLDRLATEEPGVVTLDFDGSVISSSRHAEGMAVGFNRTKKGARSYYPLFCTVAQSGQFLDVLHRPGNVHDSNGSEQFMEACFDEVRKRLPRAVLESRVDAAFFNAVTLDLFSRQGVRFTASVPFERFPELKARVEATQDWTRINDTWSVAETEWNPKSWHGQGDRFLLLRKKVKVQRSGPLQLDLFEPRDHAFEYKVLATNRAGTPQSILHFHNGRGTQEKIFAEGKQHAGLDVIPVRTLNGNRLHLQTSMLAHNLGRELQMQAEPATRRTGPRRPPRWTFKSLGTVRDTVFRRPGRLVSPHGSLTLILSGDAESESVIRGLMQPRRSAA